MISVVIIEAGHEGNVGAIARSMANFGLRKLILIDPKCDHLGEDARCRAKNEQGILENAEVKDIKSLDSFDYVIGTTAKIGTDYNIPRSPLLPNELAEKLAENPESNIAVVFGREGVGLLNDEVALCDYLVTIPTSKDYSAMNLSHAATVIFYELFKVTGTDKIKAHIPAIGKGEKETLLNLIDKILNEMRFKTEDRRDTQKLVWKRLVGKAMLTNREAQVVIGFMRKLEDVEFSHPEDAKREASE